MTTFLNVHPQSPQLRLVRQAADTMRDNGVVVYPTDSHYALGCLQNAADAVRRIRQLRGLDENSLFTICCKDFSQVAQYAVMDNAVFRLMKAHVPGAYTFILRANTRVSRRLHHSSRQTVAFRIPSHPTALMLMDELGDEPILSATLRLAGDDAPLPYDDMKARLRGRVDCVLDAGVCPDVETTVLDFSGDTPKLVRQGAGKVEIDES